MISSHLEGDLNNDEGVRHGAVLVGRSHDPSPRRVAAQEEYWGEREKSALDNSLHARGVSAPQREDSPGREHE